MVAAPAVTISGFKQALTLDASACLGGLSEPRGLLGRSEARGH